ncbi:Biotin/lipoyl attachment protein [Corynebacterium faecale]|uniref:acetyl-CoA carboxylase biotin carboxyl carrier protein subunit n=1 Tax=Corynebacterium faecale TaxID=1758466 RepID=UPI0025B2C5AA|nr:biotin/lipoyl-containing protein [Corynebacterium faecale]WJY92096.1 Biotin/lipoyl attachment protein [Corynebacterium faecale]
MKICAPFAGIVHYFVAEGDPVKTGEQIGTVEAIKLEAPILSPGPGVVASVEFDDFSDVTGGDVLLTLEAK